jgi:hypothetical protein
MAWRGTGEAVESIIDDSNQLTNIVDESHGNVTAVSYPAQAAKALEKALEKPRCLIAGENGQMAWRALELTVAMR